MMANERLRGQMAAAGLTILDMAERLEVDPKTVERWIAKGRVPHRRHRSTAARLLKAEESFLWPEVLDEVRTRCASEAEIVTTYPHRGAVPDYLWNALIDSSVSSIDVLVYAGLFLVDGHPDFAATLTEKAQRGTEARLLFGDPESEIVAQRGEEEGIGENLAARIRLSLGYLSSANTVPGVQVRQHTTILYNSIYRFDEDMLVNVHVYGFPASSNPVMHLRRVPGGRLFDHFLRSFDYVWKDASTIAAESVMAG